MTGEMLVAAMLFLLPVVAVVVVFLVQRHRTRRLEDANAESLRSFKELGQRAIDDARRRRERTRRQA